MATISCECGDPLTLTQKFCRNCGRINELANSVTTSTNPVVSIPYPYRNNPYQNNPYEIAPRLPDQGKVYMYIASIKFLNGPQMGCIFDINKTIITIGRDTSCDIVISDPFVSRLHARLTYKGPYWSIEKLSTTNSLTVNSCDIYTAIINDHDIIIMGQSTSFIFISGPNHASWLPVYRAFDANEEGNCYKCGDSESGSCGWCGVFVCLDCSQQDQDDDTICDECIRHRCMRGPHRHWEHARYLT